MYLAWGEGEEEEERRGGSAKEGEGKKGRGAERNERWKEKRKNVGQCKNYLFKNSTELK